MPLGLSLVTASGSVSQVQLVNVNVYVPDVFDALYMNQYLFTFVINIPCDTDWNSIVHPVFATVLTALPFMLFNEASHELGTDSEPAVVLKFHVSISIILSFVYKLSANQACRFG